MIFFNIICFILLPFLPLCGIFVVHPNEEVIIEAFGKPLKVIKKSGLNWYFPIFRSLKRISTALTTEEIRGSSVPDLNGSPLNVSVVITYQIIDSLNAVYNVLNRYKYLHTQALEVVRRVVSNFKYRDNDQNKITLLKDSMMIGKYMKELINIKLKIAGIKVTRMELMEISYHTEIAQGML